MNLITHFLRVYQRPDVALCNLNSDLRTRYSMGRLREWERRQRTVPDSVRRYMMGVVLPILLHECKVPDYMPISAQLMRDLNP